jgi:thioredoxin reductase (NADPH)
MTYDVIVIGAGPAGLTAGLFASRQGASVLCLNNPSQLSAISKAATIENHPGEIKISGRELLERLRRQALAAGVEIKDEKTIGLRRLDESFAVITKDNTYLCSALIIATGQVNRIADIQGEERLQGRGVSYCVLCDGPLFRNKPVAVIGGGDSAVTGALALVEMGANPVYIIHRRDAWRATPANVAKLNAAPVRQILNSVVEEIIGENAVEAIKIRNLKDNSITQLSVDGVFIEIGYVPSTELVKGIGIELDSDGYIRTNARKETNVPGVWAAGDITNPIYKILVNAYAEGAIAGIEAAHWVAERKKV